MRPILWRRELENRAPGGGGEAFPATISICGPSDRPGRTALLDAPVVIIEWRSPMGDDLRAEIGAADLAQRLWDARGPEANRGDR